MIVLLSPAKDLAKETPTVASTTQPVLLEHTKPLVAKLKTLSAKKLSSLMDLSPKLGELNRERYEKWKPPFTSQNARPAVFTFNGEVYRGLEARTLSSSDLAFAQHHLRILSGLDVYKRQALDTAVSPRNTHHRLRHAKQKDARSSCP